MKHVAYSAVRHTACQQMKVGSSVLRVDDGNMMIVQVLTMMMNILFVIYVRRLNLMKDDKLPKRSKTKKQEGFRILGKP